MMQEIEKMMNEIGGSFNYRVINLGGKKLYVEGIKNVICFGENEMQFQLKSGALAVVGVGLKIDYLDSSSCIISGEICSVGVK